MRALGCQSAWWSWPVEQLTCVYWTRPAPHYPGRTPCLPPFSFSLLLSFTLFKSISITPVVWPSHFLLHSLSFFFFFFLDFINPILLAALYILFSLALRPCSSISPILLFPFSILTRCPFLFCIILRPLCQTFGFESTPSLCRRCSSLLRTWLSTGHGHAHAAATRLIETCVSKLLMFTEALYRR